MSLAGFQQALTGMTLDAALAARVRHEGAPALAAWPLTVLEQRRLLNMARQSGMELNCTLARGNRFAAVHDAFAMSCALLGPALRAVLDDLWAGHDPRSVQLAGDTERFAAVAQQHVAALPDPAQRRNLIEVLAYEQQCYELALSVRHRADPEKAESEPRWVAFGCDPQPLFDALRAHEPLPQGLPQLPHRVRLRLVGGELETAVFEVQTAA